MPTTEVVAVNQCSGNSRGFFAPRVAGGQAGNGLMGAAVWRGVSLKRVLDRAGVKAGAVDVRFDGMDGPVDPATPSGIAQVLVSADSGVTWTPARLGKDLGRYSFRQWSTTLRLPVGGHQLRVQAISRSGERQPAEPRWNPAGYRRNVIESVSVQAA